MVQVTLDTDRIRGSVLGMKTFELTYENGSGFIENRTTTVRAESAHAAVETFELNSRDSTYQRTWVPGASRGEYVSKYYGPRKSRVTHVTEIKTPRKSTWSQGTEAEYAYACSEEGTAESKRAEREREQAYADDLPRYTAWLERYYRGQYASKRTPDNAAFYMRCDYEDRVKAGLVDSDISR